MKQQYVRPEDLLDDDTVIVVRGGELDAAGIRADAERMHGVYGLFGISVLAVVLPALEPGVSALLGCAHRTVDNPALRVGVGRAGSDAGW